MKNAAPPKRPSKPVRVITTDQLTRLPAAVIAHPDMPYTIIVVREGATFHELVDAAWDELTHDELAAWCNPWGLHPADNPWETLNPDQVVADSDIKPEHRLPGGMSKSILALI